MATITKGPGRPAYKVKLPRRIRFTVENVIDTNSCCALTIRSNLKRLVELGELFVVGTKAQPKGSRGRPSVLYSRQQPY